MFVPKLVTTLQTYTRQQFVADAVAGVIVGVVALSLAIAFAIASGVTPDRGLYTAVIAGFLISALGGSRVQIGDVNSQPLIALGRSGLLDEIGEENLFGDVDQALEAARQRVQPATA